MTEPIEAVMEPNGEIRLLEPLTVTKSTRLLVMVLPERSADELAARRAEAEAEMRAGRTLRTPDAIKLFESLVSKAGRE